MSALNPKWIIGRKIVDVKMNTDIYTANNGDKATMHDPVIVLDNGAKLCFHSEEHPDGDIPGICILYIKPPKGKQSK